MKKYLLSTLLLLSTSAVAYQGATTDFTKEILGQSITQALLEKFEADNTQKQCINKIINPTLDELAQKYTSTTLTNDEIVLLDKLFDTPFGKELFRELRAGNLKSFGAGIDVSKYDEAEYEQYEAVMTKYLQGDIKSVMSSDGAFMKTLLMSAISCDLIDFSKLGQTE